MTFKPSPAQQAFYNWVSNDSGNAILNAVAGAGKTTTILTRSARRVATFPQAREWAKETAR